MPQRTLEITACMEKRRDVSKRTGNPYVIYEVHANDEHGEPVGPELVCFEELKLGTAVFEVEKGNTDPKYPASFKLRPVDRSVVVNGNGSRGMAPAVREELDVLWSRFEWLKGQLEQLQGQPAPENGGIPT